MPTCRFYVFNKVGWVDYNNTVAKDGVIIRLPFSVTTEEENQPPLLKKRGGNVQPPLLLFL